MKKLFVFFLTAILQLYAQTEVFFTIHCEPNNAHLFPKLVELVQLADLHNIPLTIEITPQWAEAVLNDPVKLQMVRDWQALEHEIGAHHHGIEAGTGWDGYTNTQPNEWTHPLLHQGNMLDYMDILTNLGGDSLMLTGGFGADDVDWPAEMLYQTWGHALEDAISQPIHEIVNGSDRWTLGYSNVTDELKADQLIALYPSADADDIFGMVTHVYNFNDSELYLRKLFDFFDDKNCKTVRQIMRGRGLTTSVTGSESPNVPKTFQLFQNYPNPFNPVTKINFNLPAPGNVSLKIYNVLGNEISTIIDKEIAAGFHEVEFNAASLPSGTYYYQLRHKDAIQTGKMIILK